MGTVKIGDVVFKKDSGYNQQYKENSRSLSAELVDGYVVNFETFNDKIIIANNSVSVIITVRDDRGALVSETYLQRSQAPTTIVSV